MGYLIDGINIIDIIHCFTGPCTLQCNFPVEYLEFVNTLSSQSFMVALQLTLKLLTKMFNLKHALVFDVSFVIHMKHNSH